MKLCIFTLLATAFSAVGAQNLGVTVNGASTNFTNSFTIPLPIKATLYWQRITPDSTTLVMGVVAQPEETGGWVGVGFNQKLKMTPSTAVIACKPSGSGQDTVLQYDLSAKALAGVQPTDASVLSNSSVEYRSDGTVAFVFTIPLPFDNNVNTASGAKNGMIFAYGSQPRSPTTLPMHTDFGTALISLDGKSSSTGVGDDSRTFLILAHAACMGIAWLLLVPLGAFFANMDIRKRLFAYDIHSNPRHTYAHKAVMWVVFAFVLVGIILGLFFIGTRTQILHMVLGLIVKVMLITQKVLGYWRTTIVPTEKPKTSFEVWKKKNKNLITTIHKYNGRILWILAVVNIYVGIGIYQLFGGVADKVVYGVLVGLGGVFFIAGPLYGTIGSRSSSGASSPPLTVPASSAPPMSKTAGYEPLS